MTAGHDSFDAAHAAGQAFQWGDALPVIHGRQVVLQSLTDQDAPDILAIFGDPEVMRFWSSPTLADLAAAAGLIADIKARFESRRMFQWGVARSGAPQVIGTCTLHNVDFDHKRAEIGFALRRDMWGQGLASDAVSALIAFSFDTLGLHRLEADIDPDNARSQRVLERQGFRKEGYLRERWHHLGEWRDTVFLGLLRQEWTLT